MESTAAVAIVAGAAEMGWGPTVAEAEVARKVTVHAAVPMADEVAADTEVDTVAGCCNATPPQQHGTRRRLAR